MPPCDQLRVIEQVKEKEEQKKKDASRKAVQETAKGLGWTLTSLTGDKYVAQKPYSQDKINIEILKDGTIKTTTDKISMANHMNAEQFMLNIASAVGGKWNIRHKHGEGAIHSHVLNDA